MLGPALSAQSARSVKPAYGGQRRATMAKALVGLLSRFAGMGISAAERFPATEYFAPNRASYSLGDKARDLVRTDGGGDPAPTDVVLIEARIFL
ncbi:hypothetical protein C6Y62_08115 [Hyphomicrobium sulfonivorans]|nr:hypothetical protein [Hyphomicrobium sulfonivorans]